MNIPLTQGQVAVIDDADASIIGTGKWHATWRKSANTYYAQQSVRVGADWKTRFMHRVILGAEEGGLDVDHKNHNGLDNRRSNLRFATRSQNLANARSTGGRSRYRGVVPSGNAGTWRSQIKNSGKTVLLGTFSTEIEAAQAYNNAARELYGEFAILNDVSEGTPTRIPTRNHAMCGTSFNKQCNKWRAYVYFSRRKQKHLGSFATQAEALAAVSKFKQEIQNEHNECPATGVGHGCASSSAKLV